MNRKGTAQRQYDIATMVLRTISDQVKLDQTDSVDLIVGLHIAAAIVSLKTNGTMDDDQKKRLRDNMTPSFMGMYAAHAALEELHRQRDEDLARN